MSLDYQKSPAIQTLRGVAITLIVLGHSMFLHRMFAHEYGLSPRGDNTWLDQFFAMGVDVRMPLFTVISGFVYAYRPVTDWSLGKFFGGKVRRILIPLLVVTVLEFFYVGFRIERADQTHLAAPGHFWSFLIIPNSHLWFLHALLWIFSIIALLDAAGCLTRLWGWLVVLILASAGNLLGIPRWGIVSIAQWEIPNYAGYASALYLAPFFVFGLGLYRFGKRLMHRYIAIGALLLLGLPIASVTNLLAIDLGGLGALLTGFCSSYLLIFAVGNWNPLARLGSYSYAIYLYHGFGIFFAYEALLHLHGHPSFWMFLVPGSIVGLGLPILFQRTIGQLPWVRTALFGLRVRAADEFKAGGDR